MEDSRSPSDAQLSQAAVGSFDSAANSIALTKHLGVLFTPSAGEAAFVRQAAREGVLLDARLGLPEGDFSYLFQEWDQSFCVPGYPGGSGQ